MITPQPLHCRRAPGFSSGRPEAKILSAILWYRKRTTKKERESEREREREEGGSEGGMEGEEEMRRVNEKREEEVKIHGYC